MIRRVVIKEIQREYPVASKGDDKLLKSEFSEQFRVKAETIHKGQFFEGEGKVTKFPAKPADGQYNIT
jgi:hypothetical protein